MDEHRHRDMGSDQRMNNHGSTRLQADQCHHHRCICSGEFQQSKDQANFQESTSNQYALAHRRFQRKSWRTATPDKWRRCRSRERQWSRTNQFLLLEQPRHHAHLLFTQINTLNDSEDIRIYRTATSAIGIDHYLVRTKLKYHLKCRKKPNQEQPVCFDKKSICKYDLVKNF